MTQQPFSRPGAIDLSGLRRPAGPPAAAGGPGGPAAGSTGQPPAAGPGGPEAAGGTAYSMAVTEQNFQSLLEASVTAPVLLAFYSRTRMPESGQLADDLETLAGEFEGKFLAGLVDIDVTPAIAQAMQIPSIPLVVVVLDGRPMPLLQDVVPIDELRTALTQVFQQFTVQGVTGRHQPRHVEPPADADAEADEAGEPLVDPRYAAAQDALGEGDVARAVAEYQKLIDANPADTEAAAGLAMAKLLQRTQGVDDTAARTAAGDSPDDVDAQTLVADLDLLGGQVDDAIDRLVDLVRRTSGAERNHAREHLLGIFAAVGNDDARVLRGRQNLASALF